VERPTLQGRALLIPAVAAALTLIAPPGCATTIATFHDGSTPTKRPIVIPPAPRLRAVALKPRVVRIYWSFRSLPSACRPAWLQLAVRNGKADSPAYGGPVVRVVAKSGVLDITVPDFFGAPREAGGRALDRRGRPSLSARAQVERS
jgi:hypothetical protein